MGDNVLPAAHGVTGAGKARRRAGVEQPVTALPAPARSRLWTPRHVVVTRSAAERPHTAEVLRRVEAAERFASRAQAVDARALAVKLYPDGVSAATTQQLARAESPGQALALLLVAPEAMRR